MFFIRFRRAPRGPVLSTLIGASTFLSAFSVLVIGGCASKNAQVSAAPQLKPRRAVTIAATPKAPLIPKRHGPPRIVYAVKTQKKVFALTFDDGPDPSWTPQVVSILKASRVPATFFMVGKMVRAHGKFAKIVQANGFNIGNHSWTHPSKPKSPVAEIDLTSAMIFKTLGIHPVLFRPPYGLIHNGLVDVAKKRGMDSILWSSAGADWDKKATAGSIASQILKNVRPGGIALLHDGGGNRSQTVAALPRIISTIRSRGYTLVGIPQLLAMGPPTPLPVSHRKRRKGGKIVRVTPHLPGVAVQPTPKTPANRVGSMRVVRPVLRPAKTEAKIPAKTSVKTH